MENDSPQPKQCASSQIFPRLWLAWIVVAVLAAVCAWLTQACFTASAENARLRELSTLTDLDLRSTRQQLEAERLIARRRLTMQGDPGQFAIFSLAAEPTIAPHALAVAVWNPAQQEGILQIDHLPTADADHVYQVWLTAPKISQAVSGGTFGVDSALGQLRIKFHADQPLPALEKITVTLVRKDAADASSGPVILSSR